MLMENGIYKYSSQDSYIYIDSIDEEKVTYHFECEKTHTAKLKRTKTGKRYFFVFGDRYYLDEFEKVGDE